MGTVTLFAIMFFLAAILAGLGHHKVRQLRKKSEPDGSNVVVSIDSARSAASRLNERASIVEARNGEGLRRRESSWQDIRADFVVNPDRALARADQMMTDVMIFRGHPVHDFEQRAANSSADPAGPVRDYRAAHRIALRSQHGKAGAAELRRGMDTYGMLFEDMIIGIGPREAGVAVPQAAHSTSR